MKFVIPAAEDAKAAEHLYNAIKKFAVLQTRLRLTERRIFRIEYMIDGLRHFAEVGKTNQAVGEQVFAILETETRSYLVCSPNRCVYRNDPMLVEARLIRHVLYFEEEIDVEPADQAADSPPTQDSL
ncbi:MAG: hypothetical protein ABL984_01190 [Pyrinomonadaceae bacterium]